ncbi:MAG: DNA-binding protein [Pseudomonadota bacterium]
MPRSGISYEDVEAAINTLEKAGLTPSIRLIREKLGKGSLSTIAEHKRAFDANRATGPGPAIPDPVAKHLLAGAQSFWQELVDAAEGQIEAIQANSDDHKRELQRELEDAQHALSLTQDTVGELQAKLGDCDTRLTEMRKILAERDETLSEQAILVSRLQTERDATIEQRTTLQSELESTRTALASAQAEAAQLSERLERQAVENSKDKVTLQKHFNEYKDRLVTMSDERRQALDAQRVAEKHATAMDKQAEEVIRESERLKRELTDAQDEVRLLTETIGEVRGEVSTLQATSSRQLADRDAKLEALQEEVETLKSQVRDYANTDRSLVQALIDERQSTRG